MSSGRTTWFAHDVGLHRRGLWVEVGEEFGPGGVCVLHVLCSRAGEQRDGGRVREGFPAIAREAFVGRDVARQVVEFAATIGLLDELAIDGDGRRFSARISGWVKDQEKGRAAWRKASQRERDYATNDRDEPAVGVTSHGCGRSVTPSPLHNNTEQDIAVVVADAHASASASPSLSVLIDITDLAVNALVAAGYDRDQCLLSEGPIRAACQEFGATEDTDWDAVARQVAEVRGRLDHDHPVSALRWAGKAGFGKLAPRKAPRETAAQARQRQRDEELLAAMAAVQAEQGGAA